MQNNSGGSKVSDFQPPTQNPQGAGANLQPTRQGLQPSLAGSQEQLNIRAPLRVETAQGSVSTISPTPPVVPESRGYGTGILLFLAAVLLAAFLFKKWNLFNQSALVANEQDIPNKKREAQVMRLKYKGKKKLPRSKR